VRTLDLSRCTYNLSKRSFSHKSVGTFIWFVWCDCKLVIRLTDISVFLGFSIAGPCFLSYQSKDRIVAVIFCWKVSFDQSLCCIHMTATEPKCNTFCWLMSVIYFQLDTWYCDWHDRISRAEKARAPPLLRWPRNVAQIECSLFSGDTWI